MTKKHRKPRQEIGLTTSKLASLHEATGLSATSCRRLILAGKRPANSLTAAAWDEALAAAGIKRGAK